MPALALFVALWWAGAAPRQVPDAPPSIAGGWTLNTALSDAAPDRTGRSDGDGERGRDRGQGGRGRGMGRGRRGGFGGRGGGGPGNRPESREATQRMRDAMRDVMEPSERLTITETPTTIVITGADGRTTRLSPDGKKVKDENTNVERKTKWEGGRLVSEINGLGRAKMTQTFSVEPETGRLRVIVQVDGAPSAQPRTITHVYDADLR
jgi:hypothetical protein